MARLRRLVAEVARLRPDVEDPEDAIASGIVLVDGVPVRNPNTMVAPGTSVVVSPPRSLRGVEKLGPALDGFGVAVDGRVGLDAGASAGGFTRALLDRGARRVYAVEVGHGQLVGSLRQDERVVSLERTNVGRLDRALVPDAIDVVVLDLGFLALAEGVPQLNAVAIAPDADLVALVKPMFELRRADPPEDDASLDLAFARAADGIEGAGWSVAGRMPSPIRGGRGAVELLLHARRA